MMFCMSKLLVFVFFATVKVAKAKGGQELDLIMNAPINSELAIAWVATLQKAYDAFVCMSEEFSKSSVALGLKTTAEFEIAAKACFSLIKGKALTTIEDFKLTARAISSALAKVVVYAIRAIGDLASKEEKKMATKLAFTTDLMQNALEITYNLIPLAG